MLSLKGNQGTLHDDVTCFFESEQTSSPVSFKSIDGDHGAPSGLRVTLNGLKRGGIMIVWKNLNGKVTVLMRLP